MINVVLYQPLIPPNTGNIARLCVGIDANLHLIEPLGFDLSEKSVRRAGLDYWQHLNLTVHKDYNAFLESQNPSEYSLLQSLPKQNTGMQILKSVITFYLVKKPKACLKIFMKSTKTLP